MLQKLTCQLEKQTQDHRHIIYLIKTENTNENMNKFDGTFENIGTTAKNVKND